VEEEIVLCVVDLSETEGVKEKVRYLKIPTDATLVDSQMSAIFALPVSANPQIIPLNPPKKIIFLLFNTFKIFE